MGSRGTFSLLLGMVIFSFCVWHMRMPQVARSKEIIFLCAPTVLFHAIVEKHFLAAVNKNYHERMTVRVMTAASTSDKIAVMTACEAALMIPSDCLVVVGRSMAQALGSLAKKKGVKTPIVCIGVERPVVLGLVESMERPGGYITGVHTAGLDGCRYAALLHAAYPECASVLLPYCISNDSDGAVGERAREICQYLRERGVQVKVAPLDAHVDLIQCLNGLSSHYDIMMTLEGDTFNDAYTPALARLTVNKGKGLFSGFKGAIAEGALFAYVLEPCYEAEAAINLVVKIVFEGKQPCLIPFVSLGSSREFIINKARAAELGITVSEQVINAAIEADPCLFDVRGRVRII